tara:strand:- start:1804 stop:2877 length:1074 start_codon:yes stop_codon:yes gene_type:complete
MILGWRKSCLNERIAVLNYQIVVINEETFLYFCVELNLNTMNKILLFTFASCISSFSFAQMQIGNSDMENWETVASDQEPVNWNSFLTATGAFAGFAANQIESSTDVRPGSAGSTSCRIWSRSAFTIIANGNVTLGRIEMGSITPTSASNYNYSVTADSDFSETLTDTPDSIVFWAKFTPINGGDNARMKATLHTANDYRDPEDAASAAYVVATAVLNFPSTNDAWTRFAVPFNYSGPATVNTNILVTFTTNELAGGGADGDEVLIDDIELIYNPTVGLDESSSNIITSVSMDNEKNVLHVQSSEIVNGEYEIYNTQGKLVQSGAIAKELSFEKNAGMYFVVLNADNKKFNFKILKQ